MPRKKVDSSYRQAVENLRNKHAEKIESVFLTMYDISQNGEAEDRDRVNAAKVVVSLMGVPRAGIERQPEKKHEEFKEDKPTLSKEHSAILDDILGTL